MTTTRLLSVEDAEEMLAVLLVDREFLGSSGPQRSEDFFTVEAQREELERSLQAHAREAMVPLAPSSTSRAAPSDASTSTTSPEAPPSRRPSGSG